MRQGSGPLQSNEIDSFFKCVLQKLGLMRKQRIMTDVILLCRGKKFDAHRSHLSASSEFFFNKFDKISKTTDEITTIEIPDIHPQSLEILLDILYTGQVTDVEFEKLPDLVVACSTMQLPTLYSHYRDETLKHINRNNVVILWELTEKLEDKRLLEAVDRIVREIYNDPQCDAVWIRNYIQNISMQTFCHDLLLKIIIKFTKDGDNNGKFKFDDFLEFIDFGKLSNAILTQDPFVVNSQGFRDKCLLEKSPRLQFIIETSVDCIGIPSLFILEQDRDCHYVVQHYHMGEWKKTINLEDVSSTQAILVIKQSRFSILTNVTNHETKLHWITYDNKGFQIENQILGSVAPNSEIAATKLGKMKFLVTAFTDRSEVDFVDGERYEQNFGLNTIILQIQVLLCGMKCFKIRQVKTAEKVVVQILKQRIHPTINNAWLLKKTLDWTDKFPNWFAFYHANHIVLRVFPGPSLHYDIKENVVVEKNDDNSLEQVVSLDVSKHNVWCLTEKGTVYNQKIKNSDSAWKLLIKHPSQIQHYCQIVIDKSC